MAIRLIEIENEERVHLAKLISELKGQSDSVDAMLDDTLVRLANASVMPRYILEADSPEELQARMEKLK